MKKFKVDADQVGQRADVFVASKFPEFARSALSKLFDGQVLVNNQPAKPGQKLRFDEKVSIDTKLLNSKPAKIDLPIIYEDDNVLVVNKPAGVLTHSTGGLSIEPSVASFLRDYISDDNLSSERAGIVHRLDRATSGVIIGAKNTKTLSFLQKQFAIRKTKKTYIAIVADQVEQPAGTIDIPLERNPKNPKTFMPSVGGKSAQTDYKVIKVFKRAGKQYSVVELKPLTGRTHQLRVHLAHIGHPVVGDHLYSGDQDAPRLMLHAAELEITLPGGHRKTFSADLPQEFIDYEQ